MKVGKPTFGKPTFIMAYLNRYGSSGFFYGIFESRENASAIAPGSVIIIDGQ